MNHLAAINIIRDCKHKLNQDEEAPNSKTFTANSPRPLRLSLSSRPITAVLSCKFNENASEVLICHKNMIVSI